MLLIRQSNEGKFISYIPFLYLNQVTCPSHFWFFKIIIILYSMDWTVTFVKFHPGKDHLFFSIKVFFIFYYFKAINFCSMNFSRLRSEIREIKMPPNFFFQQFFELNRKIKIPQRKTFRNSFMKTKCYRNVIFCFPET